MLMHRSALLRLLPLTLLAATLSCGRDGGGSTGPTPNPVPTLTSLSRDTAMAGAAPFIMILRGTEFAPGISGTVGGIARATTRNSDTSATLQLVAADLATVTTREIRVTNPEPGGGTSAPLILTIHPAPPVPTIDSLSPARVPTGSGTLSLKVHGAGFTSKSVVKWNGGILTTSFVSATRLDANVPAGNLTTAQVAGISVTTPPPGGGTSAVRQFAVVSPMITSIAPTSMRTGGAVETLHIYGQGFTPATVINFNTVNQPTAPPVTFVADSEVIIQVPLAQLTTKKVALVSLAGSDTYQTLTLLPPHVQVVSISPDSATLGDSIVFTARGSGFVPIGGDYSNTLVNWRGVLLGTSDVTDSSVTVAIPYEHALAGGVVSVAFVNQGDTDTSFAEFTITRPVPVITELTPGSDTIGPGPRTIFGRALGIDSTVQVYVNGVLHPSAGAAPNPWDTTGYFSAQLAAGEAATPGPLVITLVNLGPGGGTSAPDTLWLVEPNPVPTVDSATPRVVDIGASGTTVTFYGSGFLPGAVVTLQVAFENPRVLATTVVNGTTLTAVLPDSVALNAVRWSARVRNPAPTAGPSDTVTIEVRSAEISDIRRIPFPVSRIVADTFRQRLYAAVSADMAGGPKLSIIDPVTGTSLGDLPVGGAVSSLALSADGAWLYVALPGTKELKRIDLATGTVDRTWAARSDSGNAVAAVQIAASATSPGTLAVLTEPDFMVSGQNLLVIFDDTIPRSNVGRQVTWWGSALAFPSDTLVVELQQTFPSPWHLFRVGPTGVDTVLEVRVDQIGASQMLVWGDTILTDDGTASRLSTGLQLTKHPSATYTFGDGTMVMGIRDRDFGAPDKELRAYDRATLLQTGPTLSMVGVSGSSFVRWGPGKFALGGSSGISVIEVAPGTW